MRTMRTFRRGQRVRLHGWTGRVAYQLGKVVVVRRRIGLHNCSVRWVRPAGRVTKAERAAWGREGAHVKQHKKINSIPGIMGKAWMHLLPNVRKLRCFKRGCRDMGFATPVGHPFSMQELYSFARRGDRMFYPTFLEYYMRPRGVRCQKAWARVTFEALAR